MQLYNTLVTYGKVNQLKFYAPGRKIVDWTEENFEYVQYNPRRLPNNRQGLSITSLDGGISGIPDLDSLHEYNKENGTTYEEEDFCVPTPVYENEDLKKILDPWKGDIFRTHILKLGPGGFFPKHRDFRGTKLDSFRLISPLVNPCNFILEGKLLNWESGGLYFIDTAKEHELFNTKKDPSYWLVINVKLNERTFLNTVHNFQVL